MAKPLPISGVLRRVPALRISTDDDEVGPREERVAVAVEQVVTIDVERVESYELLCTPAETDALAVGFLLSEGVISGLADIASMQPCATEPNVLRVQLAGDVPDDAEPSRNLLIVSSCGLCGAAALDERIASLPRVGDTLRIEGRLLLELGRRLRGHQALFAECGGTHAAGIFDGRGRLIASAEDTGRHAALDKAIGKCLLVGESPAGRIAVLSGRASLDLLGKCARAGIEIVSAVSAPTALAIDVAERCNITLCAFVRETRATVFAHPRRLAGAAPAGSGAVAKA